MMIDGEGCGLVVAILAVMGFICGLLGVWLFGWPSWAPWAGIVAVPLVLIGLLVIYLFLSGVFDRLGS